MRIPRLALPCLLAATAAFAQGPFPGLQKVLTTAEWKRAGLDQLTPDQIGVIDAALIRFQAVEGKRIATIATATAAPTSPDAPAGASPAEAAVVRSRFWEKFGLEKISDWRSQPPMKAKVTAWRGANRFALETGQLWEGLEAIPFEILGEEVIIEARPLGAFALRRSDNPLTVRVHRVN